MIFSCFLPRFSCHCTDCTNELCRMYEQIVRTIRSVKTNCINSTDMMTVQTLKSVPMEKILKNRAQKFALKNMPAASKTVLYGPTINVVVFFSIFMPSLLLSFPSICVLQNFSSCSRKMETFSLLSQLSLLTSIYKSEAKCLSLAFLSKPQGESNLTVEIRLDQGLKLNAHILFLKY